MKKTVSEHDFRDAFMRSSDRKDSFSYYGLTALYDYLVGFEEDCGEEFELDIVGIDCEWAEYRTALEAFLQYKTLEDLNIDVECALTEEEEEEEKEARALSWLENNTQVISFKNNEFMSSPTSGIIINTCF